jgi:hypothetical protein
MLMSQVDSAGEVEVDPADCTDSFAYTATVIATVTVNDTKLQQYW